MIVINLKHRKRIYKLKTLSMTFLNRFEFKTLYGERIYVIAKNIEKLYQKQTKIDQHVIFLKKCKQLNLIPKGLYLKNVTGLSKNRTLISQMIEKIRNNLLEYRFKQQRLNKIELNAQIKILSLYIKDYRPDRHMDSDIAWINKHDRTQKQKLIKKHEKKLETLNSKNNSNKKRNRKRQTRQMLLTNRIQPSPMTT